MTLHEYIETIQPRIVDTWKALVTARLAIALEDAQLVDHMPQLLDDIVATLRTHDENWAALRGAQAHGRHRMESGTNIGAVVEEIVLIMEAIVECARQDGRGLNQDEMLRLSRVLGRSTAASTDAYAAARDRQLSAQAHEHFSFVAHDLRTPLQAARLAARLLAEAAVHKRPAYLARLERSLAHVIEVVDSELVEVRLSGAPVVHAGRLDLQPAVAAVCADLQGHAEDHGVELSADVEPIEVDADEKLLVSALSNLVQNALKFTRPGGRVEVRGMHKAGRVAIEVEDECGGIPDELVPRLFHPFVQAHEDKSGHGLGLMIVKQAVEAHEGSVHVSNKPGQGCVFVVELPAPQPPSGDGDA